MMYAVGNGTRFHVSASPKKAKELMEKGYEFYDENNAPIDDPIEYEEKELEECSGTFNGSMDEFLKFCAEKGWIIQS